MMPLGTPPESERRGYDGLYSDFDSPLMRQVRSEAYGKDIGQHSWVSAEELEEDILRLKLTRESRLLDVGCGPCGPLAFIVNAVRCHGSGVDLSPPAIAAGRARVASLGLAELIQLQEIDLNEPLPFANGSFESVISIDVVLHVRDRAGFFRKVVQVLKPAGRFLFTDAGVITGAVSNEEIQVRAARGYTQFVPVGFNERLLASAGFHLLEQQDRTASLVRTAKGRCEARLAHRAELEQVEGVTGYAKEQRYLETVVSLGEAGSLSRMMYLAESRLP